VKKGGGLSFNSTCTLTRVDEKLVQMILHEYKIFNAEVSFIFIICFIYKWLRKQYTLSALLYWMTCMNTKSRNYVYRLYFKNCRRYLFIYPNWNMFRKSHSMS